MSNNRSRGALQVISGDPAELNAVLQGIRNELDEVQGLRGRANIYDRARVSNPVQTDDAVNLSTRDASDVVTSPTGRMTYGKDNIKYTDANGTVLHGFGNI